MRISGAKRRRDGMVDRARAYELRTRLMRQGRVISIDTGAYATGPNLTAATIH